MINCAMLRVLPVTAVFVCATVVAGEVDSGQQSETWAVRGGATTIWFDSAALSDRALSIARSERAGEVLPDAPARRLVIMRGSTLTFTVVGESLESIAGGHVLHVGDLRLQTADRDHVLGELTIAPSGEEAFDALWVADSGTSAGGFQLHRVKLGFDRDARTLTIRSPELRLTPALARRLGDPTLAGTVLGSVTVRATAEWVGGAKPLDGDAEAPPAGTARLGGGGGDMTFCQLYGLYQPVGARVDDIVGLSVGTTSWNIGDTDLMWFPIPNEEHPFIVMNLFRLKDDRLEQIGQSCIKHGFYALGSHQCGGPPCTHEPGHGPGNWLGTGCTDTYSAALNAVQAGMGPKYEVNPWNGYWYFPTSHMSSSHSHDPIQHRIQVHDEDLDPALNAGATYFVESFYVMLDDIDVMNSAAWKPVTVSGTPGGAWSFGMSGSFVFPETGFAIDAWSGATQTLVAQEIPVQEFVSPDGRCVLAAKATELAEGMWRYEYALLNIDMDRQVGGFSIPVTPDMVVTNVGFHAVQHHDEPYNCADVDAVPIDNAPWTPVITDEAVTWSTTTNPLRWSMMFNFWFDADAPPETTGVTVEMFRPGTPDALSAETVGPAIECVGDVDGDDEVSITDLVALLLAWGTDPGGPPDVDGNGTVDVVDLTEVITHWGPC